MRDRLSHPAEGLCNMQISSSFIALLIHRIISAGSCRMWPVSQWRSALWTSWWYVVTEVRPDNRVSLSVGSWHTQSEEASKPMHSFHWPPILYLFTSFSCVPNRKRWTQWIQIKRFFWGQIFFHLFPPRKKNTKLTFSVFLTWHADFPVLLWILFVLLDALGSYLFQLT